MANLFKTSIVKEKIVNLKINNIEDKIEIISKWLNSYKNGALQKRTESQCEQAFNQDIFINLLGYRSFPSSPYTIEPKANVEIGAQKPDAILGYFENDNKNIFAVVEIKDVNTSLDKPQNRLGNLTPVQQAFKYKPQYKNCRFVIATNFFEIRIFQDNQIDYESFTLETLANPKNDYYELKRLILILNSDNFVSPYGRSKTEELLTEIRIVQENITKVFYKEYSDLRLTLMRDIWKMNPNKRDIRVVADKAQKILDRIVFVCFCEDTELLPEHTLYKVLEHAENNFSNIWDTLKGFFHAIDTGSEKLGIPEGYNGGLFHLDKTLDDLILSDETCRLFKSLSKYNFRDDLTVNILGHIFEQSITDLEEIKKKVEPAELDNKSKRKKNGIYYTPEYVVNYIVENSLGKFLKENEKSIYEKNKVYSAKDEKSYKKNELEALREYQVFLQNIKVVDPACGSGAFLVKVFDYLLIENQRVGRQIGGLFDQEAFYKEILRNNIFGVDLNEESVRITQLSLWLKTAQKGKKLTYLDKNIKCGNSLINDVSVVGSKSFNWQEEFQDVFASGGFDVVVGNPPYVRPEYVDKKERDYYINSSQYKLTFGRFDLYIVFIELAIQILKKSGIFSFIVPSSLFNQNYAKYIRKELINYHLLEIVDLSDSKVFEEASVKTAIITMQKENKKDYIIDLVKINDNNKSISSAPKGRVGSKFYHLTPNNMFRTDIDDVGLGIINKIGKKSLHLERFCYVVIGAVPHDTTTGESKDRLISTSKTSDAFKPYIEGKDVERYLTVWRKTYLNYIPEKMHRPKFPELFENKKILVRNISDRDGLIATYDENQFYCNDTLSICIPWHSLIELPYKGVKTLDENVNYSRSVSLKTLLGIINSKILNFYFRKMLSSNLHVYPEAIRALPIPRNVESLRIENDVDKILELRKMREHIKEKFEELTNAQFSSHIVLSSSWDTFDWITFTKVPNLSFSKLQANQQEALYERFVKLKDESLTINNEIMNRQKEIDSRVIDLFELDQQEALIILNS